MFPMKCTDETNPVGLRTCQVCKRARPIVLFASRGRGSLICQGCYDSSKAERLRRLRAERRAHDGMKAFPVEFRRKAQMIWARARLNAWRKGLLFDLTQQWIAAKIMAGHCEATGLPFDLGEPIATTRNQFAPSLDRRDPTEGYTPENCQVVVWIYNNAKADGPHEDVVRMAKAILEHENEERQAAARAEAEKQTEAA